MNIINTINHEKLGNINCIADENGYPFSWIKVKRIKLFSYDLREITIAFNFYCFNKLFKYEEEDAETARVLNDNIIKSYENFIVSIKQIEKEFYICYKEEIEESLEQTQEAEKVIDIEDLYDDIQVKEVRVYADGFAVIIKTPWYDEEIGIEKKIEENSEWLDVSFESNIEPAEMDYD